MNKLEIAFIANELATGLIELLYENGTTEIMSKKEYDDLYLLRQPYYDNVTKATGSN